MKFKFLEYKLPTSIIALFHSFAGISLLLVAILTVAKAKVLVITEYVR
ncbi:MAG: hypothetical protein ACTSSK_13360 [Candidatus Heimdallarchaeota archaeon]